MSSVELPDFVRKLLELIARENGFSDYSMEIKSGSQAGDGFTSELFCIAIIEHKSDKRLYLVCKVAPKNENYRKEFHSQLIFSREAMLYSKLMPIFAKFQEEKHVPKAEQFLAYPMCYGSIVDVEREHFAIILEDLRPSGFKMWEKIKPSPIENVRLTVQELGKLHGVSIAMKDQKPKEFAEFKQIKDIMKMVFKKESMQNVFCGGHKLAANTLKNEEHRNILRQFIDNFAEYLSDCLNDDGDFNVLCHGDFWSNNMLFRFNERGIAEDVRFVDWQVIRYVSPATDFVCNVFSSTDKALRDAEYENILKLYYDSLAKMVKLLGSNPDELFTFDNLNDELKRYGNYALIIAPSIIQASQANSAEITKLDEAFDKKAKGEDTSVNLVSALSDKGQREFERRVSDVLTDMITYGYYHKIN